MTMAENGESADAAAGRLPGMVNSETNPCRPKRLRFASPEASGPRGRPAPDLPDPTVCEQARRSRDPRFDGLFFTAVASTGIYCRPVCPAPWARKVRYFRSAPAAEAAGFRPCLRCRPELSPADGHWHRGDDVLARALALIDEGALTEVPLAGLAERLDVSERQLRRLFVDRLGVSPLAVQSTRRLLFAKQLLTETALPITQVAYAAGFASLRRFNSAFRERYRMAPRELRGQRAVTPPATLTLRLGFRPPYAFGDMLAFLRTRALPGIEVVEPDAYVRVIAGERNDPRGVPGLIRVSAWPGEETALRLELRGVPAWRLQHVVRRVRRMFDLDAEPASISAALSADPRLHKLVAQRPGLRIPGGWDGFEVAVRAIIGQQVSVAAARTVTSRVAQRCGQALEEPFGPGLTHVFPTAEALTVIEAGEIGLTRARAATLRAAANAVVNGRVDFSAERTLDEFTGRWMEVPGIGPWTAQYIALRGLGHPDAFPAEDLVLRRAAADGLQPLTARALREKSLAWRPWRAYATLHLWAQSAAPAIAHTPITVSADRAGKPRRVSAEAVS
jgi:AraC family transcriptional regulator, regulatory protein of adaptative response / DNA-3-methyladenine glycosylase II